MNEFVAYLLQNTLILGILYLCYVLLYRNSSQLVFKRFYLLCAVLLSLGVPLLNIEIESDILPPDLQVIPTGTKSVKQVIDESLEEGRPYDEYLARPNVAVKNETQYIDSPSVQEYDLTEIGGKVYIGVVIFLLTILFVRLFVFFFRLCKSPAIPHKGRKVFLDHSEILTGVSFFNFILIGKHFWQKDEFEFIYNHELVHARNLHSLDMLIAGICCSVLWLNPFQWLIRKEIELNHELEADSSSIKGKDVKVYSNTLIALATNNYTLHGLNQFACSNIKYRINSLVSETKERISKWKLTLLIPITAVLVLLFGCEIYDENINPVPKVNYSGLTLNNIKSISTRFLGHYDDLGHKDTRLISKAFFNQDGSIEKLERYLSYPYNFDKPHVQNFYAEPEIDNMLHIMDGLPLEAAENSILYGNDWPKILADKWEVNPPFNSRRSKFGAKIQRNEKGFPTSMFFKENIPRDFKWQDLGRSYENKIQYDSEGRVTSFGLNIHGLGVNFTHNQNGQPKFSTKTLQRASFAYQDNRVSKVEGMKSTFKFKYENNKIVGMQKHLKGEVVNKRKIHYNEEGLKTKVEIFNRYGKPEYTVQYEYEYYD